MRWEVNNSIFCYRGLPSPLGWRGFDNPLEQNRMEQDDNDEVRDE